jgi:peptidoglycan lytic transglycosylase
MDKHIAIRWKAGFADILHFAASHLGSATLPSISAGVRTNSEVQFDASVVFLRSTGTDNVFPADSKRVSWPWNRQDHATFGASFGPYALWTGISGDFQIMQSRFTAIAAAMLASGVVLAASTLTASAQCGRASWYALTSRTASGERMNPSAMTAAHRSLPFGTKVKVTNKNNGKAVVVRINDRGPFVRGRVIDVSKAAARELGFVGSGHAAVCMARI